MTPAACIACVVVGRHEDTLALSEAVRWREALRARLSVLYALPAPACAVSAMGDVWCEDPAAVVAAAADWLARHAAGTAVVEQVLIPGPAGASVGDWIARHDPLLVVAARHRGRLGRLLVGDAAAHLPRTAGCAIQVVTAPPPAAPGAGPPAGHAEPASSAVEWTVAGF